MKKHHLLIVVVVIFLLLTVSSEFLISRSGALNNVQNRSLALDDNRPFNIYSHNKIPTNSHKVKIDAFSNNIATSSSIEILNRNSLMLLDGGLMNSSWPMYCHDQHHSGRSIYNTTNNSGVLKWVYKTQGFGYYGSTAIDSDMTIYAAAVGLYALYPNGSLKWQYLPGGWFESCPAIDKNGTIYIGSTYADYNYLFAFYPNGTMKWRYYSGEDIFSSPVIGNDGTIYYGGESHSINALWPNGTLRWRFQTNHVVYSSPAIGEDGTVYCGCHDTYLYALYPNNGTLKWKFPTGDWIRVSPCIADDGTIYCVSTDGYLYSIYPNGTLKWRIWVEAGTSPTIGQDGTIYAGWSQLYAINPDGSVKWIFNPGGTIQGGTPCISRDGTIFFGTSSGGDLIAVNSNGTERWRAHIGECESAPAIGEDGTIYIGSMDSNSRGYLKAYGSGPLNSEANGPYTGVIESVVQFAGTASGGILPYRYHWDFGDGWASDKQNPTHSYTAIGNYTATFTVTDNQGNTSNDTAQVTITYAPPSVSITKPDKSLYILNIRTIPFPHPLIIGPITIKVTASQEPLGIDRVDFLIDGKLQATTLTIPYKWTWYTPSFSRHTLTVIAYDSSGESASASIDVWKFL